MDAPVTPAASAGPQAKAKVAQAPAKRTKRTRDPINVELIVPGKRIRKVKLCEEVKENRPCTKENQPPQSSQQ